MSIKRHTPYAATGTETGPMWVNRQ